MIESPRGSPGGLWPVSSGAGKYIKYTVAQCSEKSKRDNQTQSIPLSSLDMSYLMLLHEQTLLWSSSRSERTAHLSRHGSLNSTWWLTVTHLTSSTIQLWEVLLDESNVVVAWKITTDRDISAIWEESEDPVMGGQEVEEVLTSISIMITDFLWDISTHVVVEKRLDRGGTSVAEQERGELVDGLVDSWVLKI